MTPLRFLVIVRDHGGYAGMSRDTMRHLCTLPQPVAVYEFGRLIVAVSGGPYIALSNGLILGALFDRHRPGLVKSLADDEDAAIGLSAGKHLISHYWGSYVAFLHSTDDGAIHMLRAPMGDCPCYIARVDGAWLCASDLALLARAGAKMDIAWNNVAQELIWPFLRSRKTCVAGVESLMGGHRISLGTSREEAPLWSPWDFVATARDRAETEHIDAVKRAVENSVTARATQFGPIALLLSGGLDSSIVASCLARRDPPPMLLNLFTRDAVGDERDYAQAMAAAIGLPLRESVRDVTHVEPEICAAALLPRPSARMFEQATMRIGRQAADTSRVEAIFTGGGGDNVFCALQSAAPVADRLLSGDIVAALFETARDISRLAPAGMPEVLLAACKRIMPWRRASPITPNLAFMSEQALDDAGRITPSHPWLTPPRHFLPGKSAHITMLALAQGFAEGHDPQQFPAIVHPLLSQPVVETCLAVPSWLWVADGRNRAVARKAFDADLPAKIAQRRTKGSPECFVGEIFEHHHARLKSMILDGMLAQRGFLDRDAVEWAFHDTQMMAPGMASELLRIVDVEAWLQARSA